MGSREEERRRDLARKGVHLGIGTGDLWKRDVAGGERLKGPSVETRTEASLVPPWWPTTAEILQQQG